MFQTTVLAISYKLPLLYEVFKPDDAKVHCTHPAPLQHLMMRTQTIVQEVLVIHLEIQH